MKECVKKWLQEQMPGMDDDTYMQIYNEYVTATKELVGQIAALDRAAHTLKGNAMMVGDQPMADVAIALRSNIDQLQQLLTEL